MNARTELACLVDAFKVKADTIPMQMLLSRTNEVSRLKGQIAGALKALEYGQTDLARQYLEEARNA